MKFDEVLPFFYTLVVLTPFLPKKKTFRVMIYVEIALEIKKEITLKFDSKKDCIIQQILVVRFYLVESGIE
jgi:hypothetical protein